MEKFRNMLICSQQQMVIRLEQMQTQSENRFTKIEAELTSFIPVKVYYVIDRLHGSAAL